MASPRNQWILISPCGCPSGVMEEYIARDESEALMEFYDYQRDQIRSAKDRGMQVKLITFEEYDRDWYEKMHDPCPH